MAQVHMKARCHGMAAEAEKRLRSVLELERLNLQEDCIKGRGRGSRWSCVGSGTATGEKQVHGMRQGWWRGSELRGHVDSSPATAAWRAR